MSRRSKQNPEAAARYQRYVDQIRRFGANQHAVIGHMPFPNHRTCAEWMEPPTNEPATSEKRAA